ncbi:YezD family protein [Methylovorus mays]|uniref:YezD family protein n=1 Tax=Methylovorus mays TaxID=184077 RepID=UPI001E5D2077|nr:YezD family protein [Methylovorus mays]MCB5207664.1 YezD family protein [Methylovorus mays]
MPSPFQTALPADVVQEILRAVEQLRFGAVEITVHDGRVTQIERREKVRFSNESQKSKPTATAAAAI